MGALVCPAVYTLLFRLDRPAIIAFLGSGAGRRGLLRRGVPEEKCVGQCLRVHFKGFPHGFVSFLVIPYNVQPQVAV